MVSEHLYVGLIGLVVVERLVELSLSMRNARRALASGGVEAGVAHYRVMQVFHAAFLVSCVVEVFTFDRPFLPVLGWTALAVAALAQALRWWAVHALGRRWNTRVIVFPELEPVTRGPYRFVRHPNYVAVVLELAALPLVHGAWLTAIAFGLGNVALLVVRIRSEEAALGARWSSAFAQSPRFIPGGPRAGAG